MSEADAAGAGTRRGWIEEGYDSYGVPRRLDVHIVDEWMTDPSGDTPGLRCVLLAVTRFFARGASNPCRETVVEEQETVYKGGVHVPELDAVLGGYGGIRPSRLEDGSAWTADWTWTTAADDIQTPGIGYDTLPEAVREKTNRLARRIASHHAEEIAP